jgi:deazaflavin-dependent oxidoreductase (nitroreductase family)
VPEERPASQENEPFDEPPLEEIKGISQGHVSAMKVMDDDIVWVGAGMKQLLLRTVGRKSEKAHEVALPYWIDEDGERVVAASYAGNKTHPAWYLNLTDREKNGEVFVKTQRIEYWADPQILDGDEYDRVWAALCADRPYYADYQMRCERRIPLVKLVEARLA